MQIIAGLGHGFGSCALGIGLWALASGHTEDAGFLSEIETDPSYNLRCSKDARDQFVLQTILSETVLGDDAADKAKKRKDDAAEELSSIVHMTLIGVPLPKSDQKPFENRSESDPKNQPNSSPKSTKNRPKIEQKSLQHRSQIGPKSAPEPISLPRPFLDRF